MSSWKDLSDSLNYLLTSNPDIANEAASCRIGDSLCDCDIYRSVATGRLHIGPAFGPAPKVEEVNLQPRQEQEPEPEPVETAPGHWSYKRR